MTGGIGLCGKTKLSLNNLGLTQLELGTCKKIDPLEAVTDFYENILRGRPSPLPASILNVAYEALNKSQSAGKSRKIKKKI